MQPREWAGSTHLVATFLFFLISVSVTLTVASRVMVPTGDEPHYLTTTHSLVIDGDISLLNNYKEQHYRLFYPGLIAKRTTASADKTRELPTFALGLSVFLAPFYALALNLFPTWLVPFLRLVICSVTTLGIYHLLAAVYAYSQNAKAAYLVVVGAAFASPLLTYSNQFYPEIFAFVLIIVFLRQILRIEERTFGTFLYLALVPGVLMWFHPKYLVLATTIIFISAVLLTRTYRMYQPQKLKWILPFYMFLAIGGMVTFFVFLNLEYGSWSPNRIYGGWQKQTSLLELLREEGFNRIWVMVRMFFGFWFDQRFGILPYAPFYIAFFPALLWVIRERMNSMVPVVILFGTHFLALCWGAPLGGYAPPSRHFVVMVPMLLILIAMIVPRLTRWRMILLVLLEAAGWAIILFMLTHYRLIFANVTWRNPDGVSPFWQWLKLDQWIPNMIATWPDISIIFLWLASTALLTILIYPREKLEIPL